MAVVKVIYVQPGQSLIDLAIQEYKAVEGMFLLMLANQDIITSLTVDLEPGTALKVWPVKVVQQMAERIESLTPYLSILMQWITAVGGSGSGGGLNDGDYVHIRGDEVVMGIKSFVNKIQTNEITDIDGTGTSVEGVYIKDGVLDAGSY